MGAPDRAALPKAGQGRQPLGLEKMLRIYFETPIAERLLKETNFLRHHDYEAASI